MRRDRHPCGEETSRVGGPPRLAASYTATANRLLLVHHAAAQRADSGNLHLEHVARFHPQRRIAAMTDPFRRAGGDHIARGERGEIEAVGYVLMHVMVK